LQFNIYKEYNTSIMVVEIQNGAPGRASRGNGDTLTPQPIEVNYNNYVLEAYSGPSYLAKKDWLDARVLDLTVRSGRWSSADIAEEMVRRGSVVRANSKANKIYSPSIILFRLKDKLSDEPDAYVGFSKQCLRRIHTTIAGEVQLFHLQARAILEGHRGVGLGRFAIQQGRLLYNEATHFGQRSASAIAFQSALGTQGIFREGRRAPWDLRFDEDFLLEEIVTNWFFQIRAYGRTLDMSTGVSIGDYPEGNRTDLPRLDHAPTMELRRRMQEEFGMVFSRGDSLNGVYEFR